MNREYHKWYSDRLGRDMELLVFGDGGQAVLFFPTRMDRFYDYENWKVIEALENRIDNRELQIFCVDSLDAESFYNQHIHPQQRINRHLQYEQYIVNEVIELMHTKNGGELLEVVGCSMGAYHAINLALKYPKLFNKAVGMSGRYDVTRQIGYFRDLFDGFHNEDIYFNMPLQYVYNLHDEDTLNAYRKMEIILAIGETDPFFANNQEFSQLLWNKNVPHQLYIWDGYAHRPRYWQKMVQHYL